MIFLLFAVVGMVAWSLHLMQQAIEVQEFSLMLAGCLVAAAAAGVMLVYALMGDYMVYLSDTHAAISTTTATEMVGYEWPGTPLAGL